MDYSVTVQCGPGQQRPQEHHDGTQQPLYHLPYLFGKTLIIDVKSVKLPVSTCAASRYESVYTDHVSQHLFVTVEPEDMFQAAVYGWSTEVALTHVRVFSVPPYLSTEAVVTHLATFGRVLRVSRSSHHLFPRAADGVMNLSMHLNDPHYLPAFLQMLDDGGHLAASLAIHTDSCHRHFYKCGGNHVTMWCRAAGRSAGTPPSL
jgi:hypothetical protein